MRNINIVLLSLLLPACSTTTAVTQTIGGDGGTVDAGGGVTVEIPAGALAESTDIGVKAITDLVGEGYEAPPDYVDGDPIASVELTPHGTTFDEPVTLTLPFTGSADELVVLRLDDPEDTTWEAVGPLTVADGAVSLEVTHFSVYSLVAIAAGGCPCFAGGDILVAQAYAAANGYNSPLFNPGPPLDWEEWDNAAFERILLGVAVPPALPSAICASGVEPTVANPTQLFTAAFPGLPSSSLSVGPVGGLFGIEQTVDASQAATCQALLRAHATGAPAVQMGFTATGIPSGETVVVQGGGGTPITMDTNDQAYLSMDLVAFGASYAASILTQPTTATCTLGPNASGTAGTDNIAVEVTCTPAPPATPCTADISLGSGVLPATFSIGGECELAIDPSTNGLAFVVLNNGANAFQPFDPESAAGYAAYVAAGGTAFFSISFEDQAALQAGAAGALADFSFVAADGLGFWELDPPASGYTLTAIDTVAQTFTLEVVASVQGGNATWPPPEDSPGSDHIDFSDQVGAATITLSGDYTPY